MKFIAIMLICFIYGSAFSQQTSSEHFRYITEPIEYLPEISPDLSLFMIPLEGGADIFSSMSIYNFSSVKYLRRGYDYRESKNYVNGIDLSNMLSGNVNFSLISLTNKGRPNEGYKSGLASGQGVVGSLCGVTQRSVRARDYAGGSRLTISASDKRYRLSMDISTALTSNDGKWAYAATVSRRFGRDAHIDGIFTDDGSFNFSVDRIINKKHSLSIFVAAKAEERGLRSASTSEAFSLTGNNLYNPSWGYFSGKIRNSKVATGFQPFMVTTYDAALTPATTLVASVAYQFGKSSMSGLSWQNAQTPQPDYYRSMPSFFANQQLSKAVAEQWKAQNPNIVQINWDELSRQNLLNGDEALYMDENRVEDIGNMQFAIALQSKINKRINIDYGVRISRNSSNNYKQTSDMMGAQYMINTDKYLSNEDSYGDPMQNDLRNPNRKVYQGDRFGYNYDLDLNQWSLFTLIAYREDRVMLAAAIELGGVKFWRYGNYEKESASGFSSFGKSAESAFDTFKIKLQGGYSFSPLHNMDATLMLSQDAPDVESRLINPLFSNNISTDVAKLTTMAAEANYNLTLDPVKIKLTAYYTRIEGQSQTYRYYDDISSSQSNMTLSDMAKLHYGVELGADAQLIHGLTVRLAASLGQFTYANNPQVDIDCDADLAPIVSNQTAYLQGYQQGGTPQSVLSCELKYSGSYGWLATITANYMTDNFVQINPGRRMVRATSLVGSPERLAQLTIQERLPAATTINIFVLKSFKIRKKDFYFLVSVNNVLSNRNIVYSGYEQMRLRKVGKAIETSYAPFDTKYLYSYGRTYFCSINYKF